MRVFLTSVFLTLALCVALTTSAQTPDGQTPANEGVCDELIGLTPGLYGLCVAYCEAQDLNLIDMEDPDAIKQAPNRRILDNYRKKMKPGDPDMPCVKAPCPCWTQQELDEAPYPPGGNLDRCFKDWTIAGSRDNYDNWAVGNTSDTEFRMTFVRTAEWIDGLDGSNCRYSEHCFDEFGVCPGFTTINRWFESLTDDEFLSCEAELNQAGADRGFDCFLE